MKFFLSKDSVGLKNEIVKSWEHNSKVWFDFNFYHYDLESYIDKSLKDYIRSINKPECTIIDVGCGNSWVIDKFNLINNNYIGIDNNSYFINSLKKKFSTKNKINFYKYDFEGQELVNNFKGQADIVFSFFSLIESVNVEKTIENLSKVLKNKGRILFISLNPFFEIYRHTLNESLTFDEVINLYKNSSITSPLVLKKRIRKDEKESVFDYYRILYNNLDLIKIFEKYGLSIDNINADIFPKHYEKKKPVYTFISFIKK